MSLTAVDQPKVFKNTKEVPSVVLFLIFVSEIGLNWLYVNFLYEAFSVPSNLTNGLMQPLFVLSFLKCAFIVLGVVFWIGKFNIKHLHITARHLKIGFLSTFFFWSLIQITLLILSSFSERGIVFLSNVSDNQTLFFVGTFLLFASSKALYDEVIYRALILPQFHLKVKRFVHLSEQVTLVFAIAASQLLYLIIQMPLLSIVEENDLSLPIKFISLLLLSILNAMVFLRTQNTFICVGLHALWFYPLFVVEATMPYVLIITVLILGFILIWPLLNTTSKAKKRWPTQDQRLR